MIKQQKAYSIGWNISWAQWMESRRNDWQSKANGKILIECCHCSKTEMTYYSLPHEWLTSYASDDPLYIIANNQFPLYIFCSKTCSTKYKDALKFKKLLA